MKYIKTILILCLLATTANVNAYEFDIDIKTEKKSQCIVKYDGSHTKNLSLDANKIDSYNFRVKDTLSLRCSDKDSYIRYRISDDDDNLIYTKKLTNQG